MLGTALGLLSIAYGGYTMLSDDRIKELKKEWILSIGGISGKKYQNDQGQTYSLLKVIPRIYGFDCIVDIPYGLNYENFEDLLPTIKSNLRCTNVVAEEKDVSGVVYLKLINKPFDEKTSFEPIKAKPWEVYLGTTDSYTDVIADMRTHTHIVISGATGTGKSFLMYMILLNLIINNSKDDINIFLSQLTDKQDIRVFKNAVQVMQYAKNLEDSAKMFAYLIEEMEKRQKLINKYNDINNIFQFNKKFPKYKLPYCYVLVDEFGFYMEESTDTPMEQYLKELCRTYFIKLAKLSRSAGIFLITGLQRPDKENMPPIFKAQLNVKVAFRQNNGASALVVLDDYESTGLPDRIALVEFGGRRYRSTSPYCDEYLIGAYLQDFDFDNNQETRYVDLSRFNYLIAKAKSVKKKKTKKNDEENTSSPSNELKGRKGVL